MFLALSAVKLRHITAEALLCTTLFFQGVHRDNGKNGNPRSLERDI